MVSANYKFIQHYQPKLAELATQAEDYAFTDPASCLVKLRCFAEWYVGFIYEELNLPAYGADDLFKRLDNAPFQSAVQRAILDKLHLLRVKGNLGAHAMSVSTDDVLKLVKEGYLLCVSLYMTFHGGTAEGVPEYAEPEPIKSVPDSLAADLEEARNALDQKASDLKRANQELAVIRQQQQEAQRRLPATEEAINHVRLQQVRESGREANASYDFEEEKTRAAIRMADIFCEYQLTDGQAELVAQLDGFLSGREHNVFLLKGYAGTGKTFITQGLTEYFRAIGRNYVLAAPTGKASKVIAIKTKSPAHTIHKTIYSFKNVKEYTDDQLDGSQTYKFYAELAVNDLSVDTVYIVDESSMISDVYNESEFFRCGSGHLLHDFLKFINLDHNDHRKKVIFIGDDAQLEPVGMKNSPALDASYLHKKYGLLSDNYELTEVVRQKANSGVMENAIAIRKAIKNNVFNQLDFDLRLPDVVHIEHSQLIEKYLQSCDGKVNAQSMVIAHSNVDVASYNRRIREEFFPGVSGVSAGDKVMATTNSDANGFLISNGDFGVVRNVLADTESRTVTIRRKSDDTSEVEEIFVELRFRRVEVGFRDLEGNVHYFEINIIENLLHSDAANLSSDENKALYLDFCIRNKGLRPGTKEFIDTLRNDPYFNSLRLKFGYAITCHKAQGSEWQNVFVKCTTHQSQLCAEYFRWLYTAITRTSENLYLLEEPHIKLGAGIKVVSDPGADPRQKAPSEQEPSSTAEKPEDTKTAKIPPSADQSQETVQLDEQSFNTLENHFLSDLLKEVKGCLTTGDVAICDIQHQQYQEVYVFTRGAESTRVNITYNGKKKIRSITLPIASDLGSELLKNLSSLKGRVLSSASHSSPEFDELFLEEFYCRLKANAVKADIEISQVESHQYLQRYWFGRPGETAVVDIYYNNKKQFTKCEKKMSLSNSALLVKQALALVTEGMM